MLTPTEAEWIIKAMIAVAAADGRLNAREVAFIQKVFRDRTGRSVEVSGVVMAVQTYGSRRDLLAEIAGAASSLSLEAKDEIIRAAYLTLLADGMIAAEEIEKVRTLAAILEVPEHRYQAIVASAEAFPGEKLA